MDDSDSQGRRSAAAAIFDSLPDPIPRKIVAEAFHPNWAAVALPFGIDPSAVRLHDASGGFNCVIEVSAARCLRQLAPALTVAPVTLAVDPEAVRETLETLGGTSNPLTPGGNVTLTAEAPEHASFAIDGLNWTTDYFTTLEVKPVKLVFDSPRKAIVTLRAEVSHYARVTSRPSPHAERVIEVGRGAGLGEPPREERIFFIGRITGALTDISAAYRAATDPPRVRTDILLDHFDEASEIWYTSDTVRSFFEDNIAAELHAGFERVRHLTGIKLTPTLSLTGSSPAYYTADEFSHFDVSVFHVESAAGAQAIVAAFDTMPGCHGLVEDVQHFIGNREYGVISDESVVERLFRFKWRTGGFDRSFRLKKRIEVTRDGELEDADLKGRLDLDSLDTVVFATDADTRQDYIQIGGRARSVATEIVLGDGTVLGPDDVDFGAPESTPWSMATRPQIEPVLSDDPEVREFQQRAHEDAYQHVARPFATFTWRPGSTDPQYTRLEAVTKQIFVLGQLPLIF